MRMRLGAPLLAALVGLLGAVQPAAAGDCGAAKYASCPEPCCDAQCCFSSCQQQCRTCYKLVYDTVLEKRWHTCYQTVQETVMKPVCKTCYREECKTCYKHVQRNLLQDRPADLHEAGLSDLLEGGPLHGLQALLPDGHERGLPDLQQAGLRDLLEGMPYTVCKKVPESCWKECCYTVCKPVYEQHCEKHCHQVQKKICEQHCKEVLLHRLQAGLGDLLQGLLLHRLQAGHRVHHEGRVLHVLQGMCRDLLQGVHKTVCKPVTTCKTVRKCGEWVTEQYCVPGKCCVKWEKIPADAARIRTPTASATKEAICRKMTCQCPPEVHCRKLWKEQTICEQVPCTTYVKECVVEKVPVTVCKKVPFTIVKKVPCTVTRMVQETCVKKVPYTVCRTVTEVCKKQIPYTTVHCVVRRLRGWARRRA